MVLPSLQELPEYYFKDQVEQKGWDWNLLVSDLSKLEELAEKQITLLKAEKKNNIKVNKKTKGEDLEKKLDYLESLFLNFKDRYRNGYKLEDYEKVLLRGIIGGFDFNNELPQKLINYDSNNDYYLQDNVSNSLNNKFDERLKMPLQLLFTIKASSLGTRNSLQKALISSELENLGYRNRSSTGTKNNNRNLSLNYNVVAFPDGPLSVDSPYYIERIGIEDKCSSIILDPGAFIRVKSPRKMGKTSLLYRIIDYAEKQGCATVFLDFGKLENAIFDNLQTVSKWFCASVSRELGKENKVNDFFDDSFGINTNTSNYFEDYLLTKLENQQSLLLAMDNVDHVFEQHKIADDLCSLWRTFHTNSKLPNQRGNIWKKLKIVLTHSTDVYAGWDINRSPLSGIGFVPILSDFDLEQIQAFIEKYRLNLEEIQIQQLIEIIGGHPYLLRKAVQYLYEEKCSVESFLAIILEESSPFNEYLEELFADLRQYPSLREAYQQVLIGSQNPPLDRQYKFKLLSMGLIKVEKEILSKYKLYSNYFLKYL